MTALPTLWLIVVGGPFRGESIELPPGATLFLTPTPPEPPAPPADAAAGEGGAPPPATSPPDGPPVRHWDIGLPAPLGPFTVDDGRLVGSLGAAGTCNLFAAGGLSRFLPGDVIDWGEVAILVSRVAPEWTAMLQIVRVSDPPAGLASDDPAQLDDGSPTGIDPGSAFGELLDGATPLDLAGALVAPVPVPRIFQSVYAEGPFSRCLVCDRALLDEGVPYLVEKVYRGRETILECALCLACAAQVNSEISDESRQRLEAFGRKMIGNGTGIASCRACGKPREQLRGWNLMSTCLLDQALPPSWMLLCEPCIDGLEKLLSKQTRDRYRDFVVDYFPGLPVDSDLPAPVFFAP